MTIFVQNDIDGATAYLAWCWAFQERRFCVQKATSVNIERIYKKWQQTYENAETEQCLFLGVNCTKILSEIDRPTTFIIDHQKGLNYANVQHAHIIVKPHMSSLTRLVYELNNLQQKYKWTEPQRQLMEIVDAWKSRRPDNLALAYAFYVIFHYHPSVVSAPYRKFDHFVQKYWNGYETFTDKDLQILVNHALQFKEYVSQLKIYKGELDEPHARKLSILACISDSYVEECALYLLKQNVDVAIVYMPSIKRVVCRRQYHLKDVDLYDVICYNFRDVQEIGGYKHALGFQYNQAFDDWSKKLLAI